MDSAFKAKLERLRADYDDITGAPFEHFFCPILFRDEDVALCKAHIVNQAFAESARSWTVQRRDVDSFYGARFEGDFVVLQYSGGAAIEFFADKKLSRSVGPRVVVDDQEVQLFAVQHEIPRDFTVVELEEEGQSVRIGLKMCPQDVVASAERKWQIEISKDLRIAAAVSLIKAGYLTLFELIGYRYALSPAAHLVGRQILGEFFRQNRDQSRQQVLKNALDYFREFQHMVRPVESRGLRLQGTIEDGLLLLCWGGSGSPWAMIVFIRTGQRLHTVLLPIFDRVDAVETFLNFLRNDNESLSVTLCRFDRWKGQWENDPKRSQLRWPKTGMLYPEE